MIVDYKKLVHHVDDDPKHAPCTDNVAYGFEGLREIPSVGVTLKNEILFPMLTGVLFGVGHFLGLKIMRKLTKADP